VARRRSKAFWQRPLPMLTVLVGVVAVGYWIRGSSRHKDQQAIPLMGEFNPETAAKPALEKIVPSPAVVPVSEDPLPKRQKLETPQPVTPAPDANAVVVVPAPPTTQPSAATSRPAVTQDTAAPGSDLHAALAAKERNDLLAARQQLNRAIQAGLSADQLAVARLAMADVAEKTVFSPAVVANDPLTETYKVVSGDVLARLAKRYKVSEDMLSDINHLNNKHFIREGLRMKMVHGPFHASISKSTHELHIYLQDVYLRSYRVALGANGKTPVGRWKVDNHQANPGWTDPRTGKKWHPDDPANPIGEYWIGLKGVEGDASEAFGYGIHGTIEPQTIGQDVSLGCIRLAPDDIAAVYKLLVPGESFVTVGD
jgi:lipoprotein-anchoring transpeptidase ErfK/SrfK